MSDLPPWAYRGSFIPFDRPMPAITDDPTDSPAWGLCLSEAWRPAVLGALKVLVRPETWTGSEADIEASCLGAQKILASVVEGCTAALVPFACNYDLTSSDASGVAITNAGLTPPGQGEWAAGVGWRETSNVQPSTGRILRTMFVSFLFPAPFTCESVQAEYNLVKGFDLPPGFSNGLVLRLGGAIIATQLVASDTDPDALGKVVTHVFSPPTAIDEIVFATTTAYSLAAILLGSAELTNILVDGFDTPPC